MMKRGSAFQILLLGAFCAFWSGCAMYPRAGAPALIGTWTNPFGTIWTLNNDGTFEVDLNHDNRRDAWGTFTVESDTVTIHGTGGLMPTGCKGDGVYRFHRTGDTMHFTRVHDRCKLRVKNILLTWRRK
jgi:hypothetical protein